MQTRFIPAKEYRRRLALDVTDHIKRTLHEDNDLAPYFVTITFADFECRKSANQLESKAEYVGRHYDRVYRHLTSNLMTNFSRKRHLHPLTFDFLDLPGTRHTSRINISDPPTPHVHSVYLVHRKTLDRFEALRADDFAKIVGHRSLTNLVSIRADPIDDVGDLARIVDYASKLLGSYDVAPLAEEVPLYYQFPITRDEQQTRRDSLRFTRMLEQQAIDCLTRKYLSTVSASDPFSRLTLNICAARRQRSGEPIC